ncbi:MAG: acyl-CoA dehydrogenase family protein, partial [candidate division Zixibacteria bacterium]|nr:acyl-CoA dehydrogenase family protein [candidate division Zixibacteria bacterium]
CLPAAYGGSGMDYVALGLACEEAEYVDTSVRVILSVHIGLVSLPILTWGNEDQKSRYLPGLADGRHIGAFGLTEPNAGSDVVGLQATADRVDGGYRLNGEKMWISLADVADTFLIFAWTDREKMKRREHSGITAFIVERSMPGLKTSTIHGKLGVRAGNTGSIALSDVVVPEANVLGLAGEGFTIAMFCLDQGRFTVAAGATGLIRACRDASITYSQTRKSFGGPIRDHQLVKEMIARMIAGYETSRLLWLRAAWLKNTGMPNTRETALAKWLAAEAAEAAAADAVQVHGAYGFSDEYPVERFYRNAKGSSIYEGSREMQKLIQADFALGLRRDKPTRLALPPASQDGRKS